jgi:hypothetical protein
MRWGQRVKAKGIYRDRVPSGGSHFVKASGLRWISLPWRTTIPWPAGLGYCLFWRPWRLRNDITGKGGGLTRSSPTGLAGSSSNCAGGCPTAPGAGGGQQLRCLGIAPLPRTAAWYAKPLPTFAGAIALVRKDLRRASGSFSMSDIEPEITKVPTPLFNRIVDLLSYAA